MNEWYKCVATLLSYFVTFYHEQLTGIGIVKTLIDLLTQMVQCVFKIFLLLWW